MENDDRDVRDLRYDIIERLEQYRDLQDGVHASGPYAEHQPTPGQDLSERAALLNRTQAALLRDVRDLSSRIWELEKDLDNKRWRKWMVGPCIELAYHFAHHGLYKLPWFQGWTPSNHMDSRGRRRPAFLSYLGVVPFFTIPEALYSLYAFERKLHKTGRLREAVEQLEYDIKDNSHIQDTRCLEASQWDGVLWDD